MYVSVHQLSLGYVSVTYVSAHPLSLDYVSVMYVSVHPLSLGYGVPRVPVTPVCCDCRCGSDGVCE